MRNPSRLLDRCQAGVFEFWVPGIAASGGCQVQDCPQGVQVWGAARVLAGIGHLTTHLPAPEVPNSAIAATKDGEAGDVAIVGADIGASVIAFRIRINLQILPGTFLFETEKAFDWRACGDRDGNTFAQVSGGTLP